MVLETVDLVWKGMIVEIKHTVFHHIDKILEQLILYYFLIAFGNNQGFHPEIDTLAYFNAVDNKLYTFNVDDMLAKTLSDFEYIIDYWERNS